MGFLCWRVLVLQSHRQNACQWHRAVVLPLCPAGTGPSQSQMLLQQDEETVPPLRHLDQIRSKGNKNQYRQGSRKKDGENKTALASQLVSPWVCQKQPLASSSRKEVVDSIHHNATGISCSNYRCCGDLDTTQGTQHGLARLLLRSKLQCRGLEWCGHWW